MSDYKPRAGVDARTRDPIDLAARTDAPSPDADGWIVHTPGPCPVPPETMVEIRFRDGETYGPEGAYDWRWNEDGSGAITHYRIVSPAPSAGPVRMVTSEPKISPMGWYYRCDGVARSVYRCKLGTAWEPMEVYDISELTPAELRFIADAMEQESKL